METCSKYGSLKRIMNCNFIYLVERLTIIPAMHEGFRELKLIQKVETSSWLLRVGRGTALIQSAG